MDPQTAPPSEVARNNPKPKSSIGSKILLFVVLMAGVYLAYYLGRPKPMSIEASHGAGGAILEGEVAPLSEENRALATVEYGGQPLTNFPLVDATGRRDIHIDRSIPVPADGTRVRVTGREIALQGSGGEARLFVADEVQVLTPR